MSIKFKPEEVESLKEILRAHPQGESAINVLSDMMLLQDLANGLKFPINSLTELVKQLGTEKIIKRADTKMKVGELKRVIPAYYFPINSQEDFFDKASELMRQQPGLETVDEISQKGKLLPIEKAPPIPTKILKFKTPSPPAEGGIIGYTEDEVEKGGEL